MSSDFARAEAAYYAVPDMDEGTEYETEVGVTCSNCDYQEDANVVGTVFANGEFYGYWQCQECGDSYEDEYITTFSDWGEPDPDYGRD